MLCVSAVSLFWVITISQTVPYISLTLILFPSSHPPSLSLTLFDTRMAAGTSPSRLQLLSCREMSARRTTDKRKMKGKVRRRRRLRRKKQGGCGTMRGMFCGFNLEKKLQSWKIWPQNVVYLYSSSDILEPEFRAHFHTNSDWFCFLSSSIFLQTV